MKNYAKEYLNDIKQMIDSIAVTDNAGRESALDEAVGDTVRMILDVGKSGRNLIFIGNGASASMASHFSTDFWKNGGIKAVAFNDSSLLTCVGNDYGYDHVFEKPIEMFAEAGDILIGISSSGSSENILRAVSASKAKGVRVITLSGFEENNPLRETGDVNFYVPAKEYGYVETVHAAICHCLVDLVIKVKAGGK